MRTTFKTQKGLKMFKIFLLFFSFYYSSVYATGDAFPSVKENIFFDLHDVSILLPFGFKKSPLLISEKKPSCLSEEKKRIGVVLPNLLNFKEFHERTKEIGLLSAKEKLFNNEFQTLIESCQYSLVGLRVDPAFQKKNNHTGKIQTQAQLRLIFQLNNESDDALHLFYPLEQHSELPAVVQTLSELKILSEKALNRDSRESNKMKRRSKNPLGLHPLFNLSLKSETIQTAQDEFLNLLSTKILTPFTSPDRLIEVARSATLSSRRAPFWWFFGALIRDCNSLLCSRCEILTSTDSCSESWRDKIIPGFTKLSVQEVVVNSHESKFEQSYKPQWNALDKTNRILHHYSNFILSTGILNSQFLVRTSDCENNSFSPIPRPPQCHKEEKQGLQVDQLNVDWLTLETLKKLPTTAPWFSLKLNDNISFENQEDFLKQLPTDQEDGSSILETLHSVTAPIKKTLSVISLMMDQPLDLSLQTQWTEKESFLDFKKLEKGLSKERLIQPFNTDCMSCHLSPVFKEKGDHDLYKPYKNKNYNLSLSLESKISYGNKPSSKDKKQEPWTPLTLGSLRHFGYFRGKLSISQKTINESAVVADQLTQMLKEK